MGCCIDKRQVMRVKALEKAMMWATALTKKAGDAGQTQVPPAKALEKAMTRDTALTKGR